MHGGERYDPALLIHLNTAHSNLSACRTHRQKRMHKTFGESAYVRLTSVSCGTRRRVNNCYDKRWAGEVCFFFSTSER